MPDKKRMVYLSTLMADGTRLETQHFVVGEAHVANGEVWARPVDDQRMVRLAKEVDGGWRATPKADVLERVYTELHVRFV